MERKSFVVIAFLIFSIVSIVSCVPPDPPYDGDCLIESVTKTDDNETTGLVSYEMKIAPNLEGEVRFSGQQAPDDAWVDYPIENEVVAIENWPRGEYIEFTLYIDDIGVDPLCSEYYNGEHLEVILE